MIEIGACDWCSDFCGELGLRTEPGEFPDERRPWHFRRDHLKHVERRIECVDGHVGPLHDDDGKLFDLCLHCDAGKHDAGYWDADLDHSDCPTCGWERTGGYLLRQLRSDRTRNMSSTRERSRQRDTVPPWLRTGPADRTHTEDAFRQFLGADAIPPITWLESPMGLAVAFAAFVWEESIDVSLWDQDELPPPWSLWQAAPWSIRRLVSGDPSGDDRSTPLAIGNLLSQAITRSETAEADADPSDVQTVLPWLLADAGQFDLLLGEATASLPLSKRTRVADRGFVRLMRKLQANCGPVLVLPDAICVSERPSSINLDAAGRLHREDGPAIKYADGLTVWAWHGTMVPEWVIMDPDWIDVATIDREPNVEVRRVLLERFGLERLLREGGATLVSEDETGRLWRRERGPTSQRPTEEPIVMVEVRNATREPDGTFRTYILRVPPTMRTAREAVAWTFNMGEREYSPAVQT